MEALIDMMVHPLEEVCSQMQAKLREGDGDVSRPGHFVLQRNQWNSLAEICSSILDEIKLQLHLILKPILASLHHLLGVMKAAEESLGECIAPHVRGYFSSNGRSSSPISSVDTGYDKCDSGSRKLGKDDNDRVKIMKWISDSHNVVVKKATVERQEIEIQERLRHPNVLPLLCCTRKIAGNGKSFLLVMELMDRDLDQLICDAPECSSGRRSSPFTALVTVEFMLQIAKGMEYLHRHKIMHRDLKPANILVSNYSTSDDSLQQQPHLLRVKVADFDVSKDNFQTSDQFNSRKLGTGFYRAPEVMDDESKYSKKADVYSFAMVCYCILSRKQPFDGDSRSAPVLRDMIRREGLRPEFPFSSEPPNPKLSCEKALIEMVKKCWHQDASKRPEFGKISDFLRVIKIYVLREMHSTPDSRLLDSHNSLRYQRRILKSVLG